MGLSICTSIPSFLQILNQKEKKQLHNLPQEVQAVSLPLNFLPLWEKWYLSSFEKWAATCGRAKNHQCISVLQNPKTSKVDVERYILSKHITASVLCSQSPEIQNKAQNKRSFFILVPQMGNWTISEESLKKRDVFHNTGSDLPLSSLP